MSDKTELQNIIGIQADRIFDLEERIEALEALLRELIDIEGPQPGTGDWAAKVLAALAQEQDK